MNEILEGACLEVMKGFREESVDLVVTDPPYGYGFMGKDWDRAVPSVDVWKECLRVLKSGAFAFVMSSPRQDVLSQMIVRLGLAGFDTAFSSIYWAYASGFPKAMNISKAIDRREGLEREVTGTRISAYGDSELSETKDGRNLWAKPSTKIVELKQKPVSEEAKSLDGSYGGFQPKPAIEVILVCMKPLSEKTFVDQALKNGKGVTWLDDARIPFQSTEDFNGALEAHREPDAFFKQDGRSTVVPSGGSPSTEKGRFPANLLVSDDVLNDGKKTTSSGGNGEASWKTQIGKDGIYGKYENRLGEGLGGYRDSGSFSRYFDLDKWFEKTVLNLPESVRKTFPFLICPKASKAERNKGCDALPEQNVRKEDGSWGSLEVFSNTYTEQSGNPSNRGSTPKHRNIHPTVKPLKLMSYLVTLGSRPNDVVLDPFCGSGTTCLASEILNRQWLGIDINPEYCLIARKRLATIPAKLDVFLANAGKPLERGC